MVTRSMLSSGGKGRPGATPRRGMASTNSRALRPTSIMTKLACGSMKLSLRSRSQSHNSRRVLTSEARRSRRMFSRSASAATTARALTIEITPMRRGVMRWISSGLAAPKPTRRPAIP